jgi:hypothetical protein
VATALVVAQGEDLVLVPPNPARPRRFPRGAAELPDRVPKELRSALTDLGVVGPVYADSESVRQAVAGGVGGKVVLAPVRELRSARRSIEPRPFDDVRASALRAASGALGRALRAPEEILITLTREEERLERAVGREERAGESFLSISDSPLAQYERAWSGVRETLRKHHEALEELVRAQTHGVVPNLAALVGPRTAARLVAAAGGVAPLARMRAGRIQLLGTRRRPSPERGPRYGILYRAEGMDRVPLGRRGAYARSLAALAAIAVRADATTHASVAGGLIARRDRRIAELRSRR